MTLKDYSFLDKIGEGSYGEVWLVEDKKSTKLVVKKVKLNNASRKQREAAWAECELLKKLVHPNIVKYYNSWEENCCIYLAMAYCEMGDMYTLLKKRCGKLLTEKQIIEWFIQITMAISFLHDRNILHRDLKTQNVFIAKSLVIKVGDLGIAKQLEHQYDMAKTLIGTPYYMSPELFSKRPYNFKSDIWALGCVTFEMATLKNAFTAKNYSALSYKIIQGEIPKLPVKYSIELTSLIEAMLNKNPDKRPSTKKILRNTFVIDHIKSFISLVQKNRLNPRSSSSASSKRSSQTALSSSPHHHLNPNHQYQINPIPVMKENLGLCGSPNRKSSISNPKPDSINIHKANQIKKKQQPIDTQDDLNLPVQKDEQTPIVLRRVGSFASRNSSFSCSPNSSYSRRRVTSLNSDGSLDGSTKGSDVDSEKQTYLENKVQKEKIILMSRNNSNVSLNQSNENLSKPSESNCHNNIEQIPDNKSDNKIHRSPPQEIKNSSSRERRRIKKRMEGHITIKPGDEAELFHKDKEEASNVVMRPKNDRKHESNHRKDEIVILPELIQYKSFSPDKRELSDVVVKMNETLKLYDNDNKSANKPDEKSSSNKGPIENEEETLGRTKFQHQRYQEMRKEIMLQLGMYKMHDAYKILDDFKLDQEKELKNLLGEGNYDLYGGKIIWLKLIEDQ